MFSFKTNRLTVAIILIPVLYGIILYVPPILFFACLFLVILSAQYEFYRLFFRDRANGQIALGLALGGMTSILFYQSEVGHGLLVAILMTVLIVQLFSFRDIKTTLTDSALLFTGVIYPTGLLSYLILLRKADPHWILFLLMVVWMGDAAAYYVGTSLGKRKLCPAISPNKTIEGAIGGLLGSLLAAVVGQSFVSMPISRGELIVFTLSLGTLAQLGDLVESMFKRSAGVKDSSSFIPAHGGFLDKLDSIAFAAPLFYYYLLMRGIL